MTFVKGELRARFMTRIRGLDPQRCLAIPVDVSKAVAVALVVDHYGEVIVAPFEFALSEAGFANAPKPVISPSGPTRVLRAVGDAGILDQGLDIYRRQARCL